MIELFWSLYLSGLLAFALGLALAFWLRPTSAPRLALFVLVGLLVPAVLFSAAYLSAPTDDYPEGCSDCTEWLGRYWEPGYVIFWSFLNLGGWFLGAVIGLAARIQLRG